MLETKRLFFLGAGSMGEAMIKGLIETGLISSQQITASGRKNLARIDQLAQIYAIRASQHRIEEIAVSDIIVLAVKPYNLVEALQEVRAAIRPDHLLISVVAGVSTEVIESCLQGNIPVIRSMPNTSSFVLESATAISQGRWATPAHLAIAQRLFSAVGTSVIVEEAQLNAVTALSGTGPAYIYYVVEALMQGGIASGLPEETCRELLLQTVFGAAKMLRETGKDPVELRRQVTSPNGTTMAAIAVLDQGSTQELFVQAVKRGTARAEEMGRQANVLPALS